ncbi:MAG: hypothetical protein DHS20C18_21330 [Saprospiraceae bacterium]|nr:MAG: hypothetical protein DHS20C18_21330 [Saprospiraceae bacterium]
MTAVYDYWEAGASYRQQWIGFEDAPSTATLNFQYPFFKQNFSLGGFFMHDNISPIQSNTFAMTYAYKIKLKRSGTDQLSIGIMGMLNHMFLDGLEVVVKDEDDEFLPGAEGNKFSPNLGIGAFYTSYAEDDFEESYFFAGIGINQVLPGNLIFDETGSPANIKRAIHGNAIIGYRSIEEDMYIEPSLWVNYSAVNLLDANINLKIEKHEAFWASLNLSTNKTLGIQLGLILNKGLVQNGSLRMGTMGSYNIGSFGKARGLGYEFYLAYRFEQ